MRANIVLWATILSAVIFGGLYTYYAPPPLTAEQQKQADLIEKRAREESDYAYARARACYEVLASDLIKPDWGWGALHVYHRENSTAVVDFTSQNLFGAEIPWRGVCTYGKKGDKMETARKFIRTGAGS